MEKSVRRRGSALEVAILDAAWAELLRGSYANFTMEAVADRAGTSRPVLSRRWPTRADLAVAAIGSYMQKNVIVIPDLGNVRAELAIFLQKISDRGMIAVTRILFGMQDYFAETNSSLADLRSELKKMLGEVQTLDDVIRRGVERGEIDPRKLTTRITSLPLDLVRHEALMTRRRLPKKVIAEILDSIFLPLVAIPKKIADR